MHRDGPLVTCVLALNEPADFDGGGTLVEALGVESGSAREVSDAASPAAAFRVGAGHVVLHPGNVRHGGSPVTRGVGSNSHAAVGRAVARSRA